ncbi:DUF1573 domain-containing protein [Ereboglobus luteus]|nr:DUF1573 domain-containing protein [Ereboglobus luteus]
MNTKVAAFLAMFLTILGPLFAEIQWDPKEQSITLAVNQQQADIQFAFKNNGGQPIAILSAVSSCSCLKLSEIEKDYQPGEEGVLAARYTRTNRAGPQSYKITITTTDTENPTVTLRVNVASTTSYVVTPSSAHWIMGSQAGSKALLFRDIKQAGVRPTAVFSTDPNFTAEIGEPNTDGAYPIVITAISTEKATAGFIYIDVTAEDGTVEKARIVAAVRDPNSQRVIVR